MQKVIFLLLLPVFAFSGCHRPPVKPPLENGLYVAAWLVSYDSTRGLASLAQNSRLFNEINPVWYNLNPNYFSSPVPFITYYPANRDELIALTGLRGIKILPTIQNWGSNNFDAVNVTKIINDPQLRSQHVEEIVNLVRSAGYDGIDIDYESLPAGDRDAFSAFIGELGAALRKHGKLLSVAVYAKTSDVGWAGAQDWAALASSADLLKIMAYDFHWVGSHPGPISPVDWLQNILNYARTVPEVKGKLLVGLPLYGLNWGAAPPAGGVMYTDAVDLLNRTSSTLRRDNTRYDSCQCSFVNIEPFFIYNKAGVTHTVYYQDNIATRARLAVLNQYRDIVKGITFWRLGGEDPSVWTEVTVYK